MRFFLSFLLAFTSLTVFGAAPTNLPPARTKTVEVTTNGVLAYPTNFFRTNLFIGTNMTMTFDQYGRPTISSTASGSGGGTLTISTNGTTAGTIATSGTLSISTNGTLAGNISL